MTPVTELRRIEAWGGAEYTFNRVRDRYFDQMALSGHADRLRDIEQFAELGISALRCGILWEKHESDTSWIWADNYLDRVRNSGMRPIVGLVHHGSGPPYTSLLDPLFADKLADYAMRLAERYPWVDAYTPVNEPNTTARFSGLYGIWYPHGRSQEEYLRALLGQVKAVVFSMRAIRQVRSDAELVQTDDLGRIWSTPELSSTSDLMNERRWLTYDLLCGVVDQNHSLFNYLCDSGVGEQEILWFRDNPCPPDVIGINYYVTSDRCLDHRIFRYPSALRSAEGPFVDLAAVRTRREGIQGFEAIQKEAHQRYNLPVAITEVHLGDSVDQQILWAVQAWQAASKGQANGIRCDGVTFWALLGSYFWNNLVTTDNGYYEPGVFDLSQGEPTPTKLAEIVKQCARGRIPSVPVTGQGWWQRPGRFQYELEAELVG